MVVTSPLVLPLVDEGLGNSAYLVDLGDGRALAVDPSRDLRAVRAAADQHGLRVAFAADTHLHADFLTGTTPLAAADGATVLASAASGRDFPHTGLRDGDEVDLGGLRLRALTTPGHTDEHVSYLLLDDDRPVGVFTGGSLIVGSAARTDLVDPARTEELARAQYRSLHRLVQLPDDVAVWPTHGAGSFCSAPPGAKRTSTIGTEKATNALVNAPDEDTFVTQLLSSLGTFPPYFLRLGEVNRRGPALLDGARTLTPLTPDEVGQLLDDGGLVVDVRPIAAFSARHLAGSVSIPLRSAFATWLGWVAPPDLPLVIVRDPDQDLEEVVWQAAKVGYDNLAGELAGGLDAAVAAGIATGSIPLVTAADLGETGAGVLDIRQEAEFTAGHVPGANHVELGRLADRPADAPPGPTVVMCGHGERAMTGASLLARAGRRDIAVLAGGAEDWAAAHQQPLETGP